MKVSTLKLTRLIYVRTNNPESNSISAFTNLNSLDTLITEWLSDTWVTVSDVSDAYETLNDDNICNEIVNGEQDVVTVTCDYKNTTPPLRGRYVTVRIKEGRQGGFVWPYEMNFCEVEVLSCPPGRWGYNSSNSEDCSKACDGCRDVNETCRVSDGHCFTGCQVGFWGETCQRCNCKDDVPCRMSDGHCEDGCKSGFWGTSCSERCYCKDDTSCEMVDGYCNTGCQDGYWGRSCNQRCNCVDDEPCRESDGHCENGCQDGFWGGSCDELCDCPDGAMCNQTYGSCPPGKYLKLFCLFDLFGKFDYFQVPPSAITKDQNWNKLPSLSMCAFENSNR